MDIFKSNSYPENFINNFLKHFWITNIEYKKKVITVPKKPLFLVLLYLRPLSLQTRIKLRNSLKGILTCCKLQIVFKRQNKLANAFRFKDCIPKELTFDLVFNFTVDSAMNSVMVNVYDTLM